MDIIPIEASTFEAWKKKFEEFISRMDAICAPYRKNKGKWLDNSDVCRMLNVSARTMQTYRDTGKLPYSQINNKIYYKASDVDEFIKDRKNKQNKL